ncbi:nuclear transport factor 2 family protein [Mycobacterium vicinigordonae]|uniref:Nuclear transport factor 2 family protein n=1 Tax=Mycobacterium vicinigordonae TaxID=1719132 RepID=A0A7D6E5X2_9MYCO|nr:nuclear transport factor 2 family protein [Mycobacterium vicinigordonae]QLL07563.1 nuclear transport factor 2 family protein [Mycobacterium vicinigordonae]
MSAPKTDAYAVIETAYKAVDTALSSGDAAPFAALLADDVVLVEPASHPFPGGRWQGKDVVVEAVGGILSSIGLTHVDLQNIIDDGETVCAIIEITSTNSAGQTFRMPMIEKWNVKDGKIIHIEPYYHDIPALKSHMSATS